MFCYPNKNTCQKSIEEEIKKIKLSNYKVDYNTINLDKSILIFLILIFIFINSFFVIGTITYKKELNILQNKKEQLSKYNLPLTSFQLNAIYDNLKQIDTKQNLIRKDLEFFSLTPLKKNEEYLKLSFDEFYKVKIKTSKNLNNYFSKRFYIKSSEFNNKIYKAVLSHE